ncbi:protein REVERSION-TO-ETHYLENE SENSITIVITY1 [Asparagus officinalis]|uniref:protein REVERSION-TO-ETHYLENE SENSITIVITY1 n=1 Tax=Asparagus officinalis TaxID=4686 RepID=UPI00098E51F2|nr:protein REVERSION-TO-ETHYLENE SENSITIVITY1 [Asparagus officinalis]
MSPRHVSMVERRTSVDVVEECSDERVHDRLWPLDDIDPKNAKFPCCIVWTPLPIVSWLAPYIGHLGICREDGAVLDFAGSNFVGVDNFSYGAVARYLQLDREQCCFPPNLSEHTCEQSYKHMEQGTSISWDDALNSSTQHFQHKYYNLFTCNCHSFVANCLNRLAYNASVRWNIINLVGLVILKGKWVNGMAVVRSFFPFVVVMFVGVLMAGWSFLIGLASFSFLLIGWFVFGTYCMKQLIDC